MSVAMLVGNDPAPLVKTLMQLEIAYIDSVGEVGPFDDEALGRLYTEELAAEYRAMIDLGVARNEPTLDGDPITGHQEYCQLHGVAIDVGDETADTATVDVRFMSQWCFEDAPAEIRGEVTDITFHLVKIGDEWRIEDFDHSLYGSFRALLAELAGE
jgi:hypothetical protein